MVLEIQGKNDFRVPKIHLRPHICHYNSIGLVSALLGLMDRRMVSLMRLSFYTAAKAGNREGAVIITMVLLTRD